MDGGRDAAIHVACGSEEWVEIAPSAAGDGRANTPDENLLAWALVLGACGVPYTLSGEGEGRLRVPASEVDHALEEIGRFEEENRGWPPLPPPPALKAENTFASLSVLAFIALFHNLTFLGLGNVGRSEWLHAGGAEAGRILGGEWWRTVTALTLHADAEHLLANVLIGAFFIVPLCRELGLATGWAFLLLAGGAGNFLNALMQNPAHLAVGGSTAIFGAIGILAGLGLRHRAPLRRRHLPLAAAAALLALLGTEGENTDIGAHFFGFLAGIPLGMIAPGGSAFPTAVRRLIGLAVILAPLLAWMAAFSEN